MKVSPKSFWTVEAGTYPKPSVSCSADANKSMQLPLQKLQCLAHKTEHAHNRCEEDILRALAFTIGEVYQLL